jgi:hypothetical protein
LTTGQRLAIQVFAEISNCTITQFTCEWVNSESLIAPWPITPESTCQPVSACGGGGSRGSESAILRNGSALDNLPPQVLEAEQHGEHTLKLAIEVHLITPEPFQFVGVERLAERLLANQRPGCEFLLPIL